MLSDKLSDLSVRVGDVEARAEAFRSESQAGRTRKLDELKAVAEAHRASLLVSDPAGEDDIEAAWAKFGRSILGRIDSVQLLVEPRKDAKDPKDAALRAERLERNAGMAVDHALAAAVDAELAVAEAVDARLRAVDLAEDET
ncbi:hypothetical protein SAMN05421757_102855 [Tropicimonas sediminicola]|uniref:Uncharacterized protein n=2 Tax=Tropicimonas sediminicola TaxID=1031541 RepID=A0A239FVL7_9RHOB|nr:hypothetical protein SAMN05421757_102855 [Tropicimonas sediminicola]